MKLFKRKQKEVPVEVSNEEKAKRIQWTIDQLVPRIDDGWFKKNTKNYPIIVEDDKIEPSWGIRSRWVFVSEKQARDAVEYLRAWIIVLGHERKYLSNE